MSNSVSASDTTRHAHDTTRTRHDTTRPTTRGNLWRGRTVGGRERGEGERVVQRADQDDPLPDGQPMLRHSAHLDHGAVWRHPVGHTAQHVVLALLRVSPCVTRVAFDCVCRVVSCRAHLGGVLRAGHCGWLRVLEMKKATDPRCRVLLVRFDTGLDPQGQEYYRGCRQMRFFISQRTTQD
jgi:hypothetical protein